MPQPDIKVEGVSKRFGTMDVLDNVSFTVANGGFTCIVGPSGCGKTTLLRILLGLEPSTVGKVRIEDQVKAEGVAYIPQRPLLLPWRTALQNVCLGLELQGGKIKHGHLDFLMPLMARYGLHGFEHAFPRELSGGMEQRVAILRAFARRPRILICDEPFSSVDFVTRLKLNSEFRDLCSSAGTTVVFVTHNIEEALFFADQLLVLSGRPGRVVERYEPHFSVGSHDPVEVRKDPEFGRLFARIWSDLENSHAGA